MELSPTFFQVVASVVFGIVVETAAFAAKAAVVYFLVAKLLKKRLA